MLFEYIWILLNIFHTIINSYHILLISTVDIFVLLTGFEPGFEDGRFTLRCRHYPLAIEAYEVPYTYCILDINMFRHIFD